MLSDVILCLFPTMTNFDGKHWPDKPNSVYGRHYINLIHVKLSILP